jgi:hypothetical protein
MGGLGRQAVSSATAFASTYALGHVAKRYHGACRRLDAAASALRGTHPVLL